MTSPALHDRPLTTWDDVIAVHRFLADAMADRRSSRTWEVRRWEGQWWHGTRDEAESSLRDAPGRIRMWERAGRLVAVANPEDGGDVHLQVPEPDDDLIGRMLDWAEASDLPAPTRTGTRALTTLVLRGDHPRRMLLRDRGYRPTGAGEVHRWRNLDEPIPTRATPDGYGIRPLRSGDAGDAGLLADLINAAFGHSFGPEALLNFEHAPSFIPEGQIVAVARDGTHAAHAGVVVDAVSSLAVVEPVCTHPDHTGRGLATACIRTALEHARIRGATVALVGTGIGNPANRLYERLGFVDMVEHLDAWSIDLPPRGVRA